MILTREVEVRQCIKWPVVAEDRSPSAGTEPPLLANAQIGDATIGDARIEGPRINPRAIPPFGHSVGFLLSQLGYAVARRFKTALAEVSMEPRQFAVMRAIEVAQNRSQQVLAEELQIPASSMVALLDQLEARGFVGRHLDPGDRRVRIVELTDLGRSSLQHATRIAMATEATLCAGFSESEREEVIASLQKVSRNLGLATGIHPDLGAAPDQGRSSD
jgi:DNA-binding MarR family transcriptional regulator